MSSPPTFSALVDEVGARLDAGEPLTQALPGGRLHIDRPLPFLAVHRRRDREVGTAALVQGQAAHLIAGRELAHEDLSRLVGLVVRSMADRFGSFLLLEVWSGADLDATAGRGLPGGQPVRVSSRAHEDATPTPVTVLRDGLAQVRGFGADPAVHVSLDGAATPPGQPALLSEAECADLGCLSVGLELPPTYRNPVTRQLYPVLHRHLRRQISRVLHQTFYEFAQVHTTFAVEDYRALGRATIARAGWEIDEQLARLSAELEFLLHVTPLNSHGAWLEFAHAEYQQEPAFHYRLLPFDPDLLKRRLFAIELEHIEDPTFSFLLREKRTELDRQLTMLEDRDTPRFLQDSIAFYGMVNDDLLTEARGLLAQIPPDGADGPMVTPNEFARRARLELDGYLAGGADLGAEVHLVDDVPGVMVARGNLLVASHASVAARRVEPLLHHEVGTHLVTLANGRSQPMRLLAVGLPGYEETQEGLAVFAEYVSGGLGATRLRTLASRVLAVHHLADGATFVDVFRQLHHEHGFSVHAAWTTTMRVYRSGGLAKDAIYLRGLMGLLAHLGDGKPLEPLFMGKMGLAHVALVDELLLRGLLHPAPVRPRWLDLEHAGERLLAAREGLSVLDLYERQE